MSEMIEMIGMTGKDIAKEILRKVKSGEAKEVDFLNKVIIAEKENFYTNFRFTKDICKIEEVEEVDEDNVSINKYEVDKGKGLEKLKDALENNDFSWCGQIADVLIITD